MFFRSVRNNSETERLKIKPLKRLNLYKIQITKKLPPDLKNDVFLSKNNKRNIYPHHF